MTLLEEIKADFNIDCGDNSCLYAVKKTGMRTNGGCRCFDGIDNKKRIYIRRLEVTIEKLEAGLKIAEDKNIQLGYDVEMTIDRLEAERKSIEAELKKAKDENNQLCYDAELANAMIQNQLEKLLNKIRNKKG